MGPLPTKASRHSSRGFFVAQKFIIAAFCCTILPDCHGHKLLAARESTTAEVPTECDAVRDSPTLASNSQLNARDSTATSKQICRVTTVAPSAVSSR